MACSLSHVLPIPRRPAAPPMYCQYQDGLQPLPCIANTKAACKTSHVLPILRQPAVPPMYCQYQAGLKPLPCIANTKTACSLSHVLPIPWCPAAGTSRQHCHNIFMKGAHILASPMQNMSWPYPMTLTFCKAGIPNLLKAKPKVTYQLDSWWLCGKHLIEINQLILSVTIKWW